MSRQVGTPSRQPLTVRVRLLGPLQADGSPAGAIVSAAKERSLLAAFALRPGAVVSVDSLIGAWWGDDPPSAARKTLQTYVWNLRQFLGADVISTEPPGYALRIAASEVDVGEFRALVGDGEADQIAVWKHNPATCSTT